MKRNRANDKANEDSAAVCAGCGTKMEGDTAPACKPHLDAFAVGSVWVGAIGTGLAVLVTLPFFGVSRGERIRPMGWVLWVFLLALGTFVFGLICGAIGAKSARRRTAGIGVLLSVCPFPAAWILIHLASAIRGFTFSP